MLMALVGCGGGTTPPADAGTDASLDSPGDTASGTCIPSGTLNGTLLGMTMTPKDAVAEFGNPAAGANWDFAMADFAGICAKGNANVSVANSKVLGFEYNSSPTPGVGTYPVNGSTPFNAQFESLDSTCTGTDDLAIGGTITITSLTASCISATFDLTFGGVGGSSNEHVTGSITAPVCSFMPDGGAMTCM